MTRESIFRDPADDDFDRVVNHAMSYRAFRTEVLEQCKTDWQLQYDEVPRHPLQPLRKKIRALRRHVRWHGADWLEMERYPGGHVYRALGISADFTLVLRPVDRWRRRVMWIIPPHLRMRLAQPWLSMARSFEGRALIYALRIPRSIFVRRLEYDRTLDFALKQWGPFSSTETMNAFASIPLVWVRCGHQLGLRSPEAILAWLPPIRATEVGAMLWSLVEHGAVVAPDESEWVVRWYHPSSQFSSFSSEEVPVGELVSLLREHGISRELIVKTLCTLPRHSLVPQEMAVSLSLLRERGVTKPGLILDQMGRLLSTVRPERWRFLLDTLGVVDAAEIVKFDALLASSEPIPESFASALQGRGAREADLIACQDLMIWAAKVGQRKAHVAANALAVLMDAPYNLPLALVPQARTYLLEPGDLDGFLAVLRGHGIQDPSALLRFQIHYPTLGADALSRLIALARPLAQDDTLVDELLTWIDASGTIAHLDSYEYLARVARIKTVPQLIQFAKVGFLSTAMLRYLVEEQGLRTKDALVKKWFYRRAFGIKTLRWRGAELDPVERRLFDDAFHRNAFNFWESNLRCIDDAVDARVRRRLGQFPHAGTPEQQREYHKALASGREDERAGLVASLPTILHATSGILLPSILKAAWEGTVALARQLDQLVPLMENLLTGHGPTDPCPSALELDAISLLYRSGADTVRATWPDVVGRQDDIADWGLAASYRMTWRTALRTLREPLDKGGYELLAGSARAAVALRQRCENQTPGIPEDRSSVGVDQLNHLPDLALVLDIVLAVVADDDMTKDWLRDAPILAAVRDESGYEYLLRTQNFFQIGLEDAWQRCGTTFCRTLSDRAAWLLADIAGGGEEGTRAPQDKACMAMERTVRRVGEIVGEWATQELAKFGADAGDDRSVPLNAVVTKHPAAFFAKEAAKLCTAANVAMWREARHAHLVVYDPVHRSVQGMALVYREVFPALHAERPVLVIRAINPTTDAAEHYHVGSIVDAFMSTAVEIARDTGCVAVAVTPNTTAHLLSNLEHVAHDIAKRYLDGARWTRSTLALDDEERMLRPAAEVDVAFDAYQRGEHSVNVLYLLWHGRRPVARDICSVAG